MPKYFTILSTIIFVCSIGVLQNCGSSKSSSSKSSKSSVVDKGISKSSSSGGGSSSVRVVEGGVGLKGTVKLTGSVPKDKVVIVKKDPDLCGKEKKLKQYVVSDSRLKNVVVWIDSVKKGIAVPKQSVDIKIKECTATPRINIGFVGGTYIVTNEDPILHTMQLKLHYEHHKSVSSRTLADGVTIHNFAMPRQGRQYQRPIREYHKYSKDTGFIKITSNTHNCISGYIFVFNHPYAALTDEKGTFTMKKLPIGEHVLKAWHEGFGIKEQKINITSGKSYEVNFEFGT